ncbi:hypothetical protein [Catelliglobosispora koreensis]|uniref:hypothetical protein n=1 Tax=Catelliglobosispora koreensis TaxID=129052 RepID=UPI0012FA1D1A|nr:hypothetical protein [Catelliglobosispora koreensis]
MFLTVLAGATVPAAAAASPERPEVDMYLPDLVVAGNQRGAVQVAVRTGPVVGAVLTYDLTRAASIVTVPAPAGCVAEGQFITCRLGELTTFGPVPPTFFDLSPVFTARPKDSGTLKVTLSDRSGIVATASATVSIGRVVNIRGQLVPGPPPAVMRGGEITVPLEVKSSSLLKAWC